MSDISLRMEHVYKKFRKGEIYNSLRDLIPALSGKMFRQSLNEDDEREFWALEDVSFEVRRGEALAIMGSNGAGKSTALKILSRVMKPTKGRMLVNGRLSALIEVTAGFHPDLTGRENIFLNGTILGMSKREIASKLDQIVAFSGIEEFIDTPVKRYSSGMYARLGFSVAAHVDPEVLIVDEVLSVGDYAFQRRCIERMRDVVKNGTTVLFVSHNVKAIMELCTHALLLERGKVAATGTPDAVVQRYLNKSHDAMASGEDSGVSISDCTIRGVAGKQLRFESGETAWIDFELKATQNLENLAVILWLADDAQRTIFQTSSEKIGGKTISLQAGQTHRGTFELSLNMPHGTFALCIAVYRNEIKKEYARRAPAATLYIAPTATATGAVNCFPQYEEAKLLETAGLPQEIGIIKA